MGIKSNNGNLFRYCGYWGTYSRLLQEQGDDKPQVEITIVPKHPDFLYSWYDVAEVRIRKHRTAPGLSDRISDEIDEDLLSRPTTRVGLEVTELLLHTDILSEIDDEKWVEVDRKWRGGGGIPFILICKDPSKYLFLVPYWLNDKNDPRVATMYQRGIYPGDEILFNDVLKLYKESQ